ncbi:MAG: ABC transporter ATP-binding protein [Nitrospirota bacterium]
MSVLRVSGLSKVFDGIYALKRVSFELSRGEILGILGPNAAGKTTLIHLILGLITATEGMIEVFGKDLRENRREILRRINFASNYVSLPLSLTPWENLMVYALMYEVNNPLDRCTKVLTQFELYNLKNIPSRRLSSGQMMRLSLAKAMINNPEILLLDEPTAGLDPEIAKKTRQLLKRLRDERGLSVLYTSHNLWEMQEVSDRVLLLQKGEVKVEGPSGELVGKYGVQSLEELFFKVLRHEP